MIIKVLSIIVLIQTARSVPQFNLFNFDADQYGKNVATLFGLLSPREEKTTTEAPSDASEKTGIVDFGDFKSTFKKTYADPSEEKYRQEIFVKNAQMISNHNDLFSRGLEFFTLAINQFADWTYAEYLKLMGINVTAASSNDNRHEDDEKVSKICQSPDSKDWRQEGAVTPVKFQMKCSSCWAFASAGALEAQYFLKYGVLNSLSLQQLVDCTTDRGNNGCNRGYMSKAFEYVHDNGIVTEDEYPYEAKNNVCRAASRSTLPSSKIKDFKSIPQGNEEKLKEVVCNVGPVAVAIDAGDEKFMFYNDSIYFNNNCKPKVNHAVLVVGYGHDDETELDYWIIKNSFGTSWGNEGYGKIARNKNNHCGITNLASYPIL